MVPVGRPDGPSKIEPPGPEIPLKPAVGLRYTASRGGDRTKGPAVLGAGNRTVAKPGRVAVETPSVSVGNATSSCCPCCIKRIHDTARSVLAAFNRPAGRPAGLPKTWECVLVVALLTLVVGTMVAVVLR